MRTFGSVLAELLVDNPSRREKGDRFERLTKLIFTCDPKYAATYSEIYLWSEWPERKGVDTGIDLVAKRRDGTGYCAIQCKHFAADGVIAKADIDSFFAASGKYPFIERILISTTEKWSQHAEDAFADQTIPSARLTTADLAALPFDWDSIRLTEKPSIQLLPKKTLRRHQMEAVGAIEVGFEKYDRGQIIMACGTGKTITAIRATERVTKKDDLILYCVPSISLLSQVIREWSSQAEGENHLLPVCSDTKAAKVRDEEDLKTYDLGLPSTTDPLKLIAGIESMRSSKGRKVIVTTYQSLPVIKKAQHLGLGVFSLIVCDEAHRTASWAKAGDEISVASTIHSDGNIRGRKRLYMTATPRLWEISEGLGQSEPIQIFSMDDETIYGPEFYRLGFGEAVEKRLLSDYQVLILTVEESLFEDVGSFESLKERKKFSTEDASKVIGCWNALANRMIAKDAIEPINSGRPLQRCVAFSNTIKSSIAATELFEKVAEYMKTGIDEQEIKLAARHIDGTDNVILRNSKVDWLSRPETSKDSITCKVLSNARCLVEGVDVPSLDAVLFLSPRDSQIEIVQAIGRVMRKSPGKEYGYILLPVVVPDNVDPEAALRDNKRFKGIWKVIQGLRAHDDRFDPLINKIDLNNAANNKIRVLALKRDSAKDSQSPSTSSESHTTFSFEQIEEWQRAIYAKIVTNYGSASFWRKWASEISQMAEHYSKHIQTEVEKPGSPAKLAFESFLSDLRSNINGDVDSIEAISMLSQHLITQPVFSSLFKDSRFAEQNAVAVAINKVLHDIPLPTDIAETRRLNTFYDNVRRRVEDIDSYSGKQKLISRLYQDFFQIAFPSMAKRLGIVYTPVEVVDFILRSAEHLTKQEFDHSLGDEGIRIIDPFVGTGTFLARLLQIGIFDSRVIARKFREDLHANEIVMLAYYIAAVNIESAFAGMSDGAYAPFTGITLTDTFAPGKGLAMVDGAVMCENSARLNRQRKEKIKVIVGNPPYSLRQRSANDQSPNQKHPELDEKIRATYIARSKAKNTQALYDPHVKAIRWATDRLEDKGLVCFVTNGSFVEKSAFAGLRLSLAADFKKIFVYSLRGNTRNSGETARKEGGQIFAEGSRASIALVFLVKDAGHSGPAEIFYREMEDYLSREEKLKLLEAQGSTADLSWDIIRPDPAGAWVHQGNDEFQQLFALFSANDAGVFKEKTLGIVTSRDAWVYGFSADRVALNVQKLVTLYGEALGIPSADLANRHGGTVKWSRALLKNKEQKKKIIFDSKKISRVLYRPFVKKFLYVDKDLNEMPSKSPSLTRNGRVLNPCILVGKATDEDFPVFATDGMYDFNIFSGGASGFYGKRPKKFEHLKDINRDGGTVFETNLSESMIITISELAGRILTRREVFSYVYGLLHVPKFRSKFGADLRTSLPRFGFYRDFERIWRAGLELLSLHIHYEKADLYPLILKTADHSSLTNLNTRIQKIRFGKKGKKSDKTCLVLNGSNIIEGVPTSSYDYLINKKSPVEWIMDQYQYAENTKSKTVQDPNEQEGGASYIVQLLARAITVSLRTQEIKNELKEVVV